MSAPFRIPPLAPPPLPSFTQSRSSVAVGRDGAPGSPGFSLSLPSAIGSSAARSEPAAAGGLTSLLVDQVKGVNTMQTGADAMVHSLLTGGNVNEAEVLTAVQKADLAFRMLMQIRNKLMDAYREVQQIQI